jgi:hypothetical protein
MVIRSSSFFARFAVSWPHDTATDHLTCTRRASRSPSYIHGLFQLTGSADQAVFVSSTYLLPLSSSAASTSLSKTALRYFSSAAVLALTILIMYVPHTTELLM